MVSNVVSSELSQLTLYKRCHKPAGVTKSWDKGKPVTDVPVTPGANLFPPPK